MRLIFMLHSPLFHRAEDDIRWIGLKINAFLPGLINPWTLRTNHCPEHNDEAGVLGRGGVKRNADR